MHCVALHSCVSSRRITSHQCCSYKQGNAYELNSTLIKETEVLLLALLYRRQRRRQKKKNNVHGCVLYSKKQDKSVLFQGTASTSFSSAIEHVVIEIWLAECIAWNVKIEINSLLALWHVAFTHHAHTMLINWRTYTTRHDARLCIVMWTSL